VSFDPPAAARKKDQTMKLKDAVAWALALFGMAISTAQAHDEKKYPNLRGQWVRVGSAQFNPTRPPGFAQGAPLNPEYTAIFQAIIADRTEGGLAANTTASCLPGGMPRTMIVYETLETLVTAGVTFIRGSYMNELRRIYTDGRDWPAKIPRAFVGYSIGKWVDEDGDGRYDVLEVETRGLKGPRTYDGAGMPMHKDNRTIIKERISMDKSDPDVFHNDITTIDNALTRPWTVYRSYRREKTPTWSEYICEEGNGQIRLGSENYMISSDGFLMPVRRDQGAPDLRHFKQPQK
jgi:hypothetical protein